MKNTNTKTLTRVALLVAIELVPQNIVSSHYCIHLYFY